MKDTPRNNIDSAETNLNENPKRHHQETPIEMHIWKVTIPLSPQRWRKFPNHFLLLSLV